jgi:hypothetical protein
MPMELVRNLPYDHPYRWDGTLFGGPKLWRPSEIQTSLWLDAEDASTITLNGSTVSQWNDKSGNGRNFSQATAINQPTYNAASKLLAFNNSNLAFSGSMALAGAGALIVGKLYSTSTANSGVLSFNGGSFDYVAGSFLPWASGFLGGSPTGADAYYNGLGNNNRSFTMNTTAIYGYVSTEGIYRNGALLYAGNNGTTGITQTYGSIGSRTTGASVSARSIVDIYEIVLTPTPPSAGNRQKIEGYLAWKWGLEASLPAGHPYKNLPPTV